MHKLCNRKILFILYKESKQTCSYFSDVPTKKPMLKKNVVPSQKLPRGTIERVFTEAQLVMTENRRKRHLLRETKHTNGQDLSAYDCFTETELISEDVLVSAEEEATEALMNLKELKPAIAKEMVDQGIQVDATVFSLKRFTVGKLIRTDEQLCAFTGIPHFGVLHGIHENVSLLESNANHAHSTMDRIIMTFIKLKLNMSYLVLGTLFDVSRVTCKNYIAHMIPMLSATLGICLYWPDREEISRNIPLCFKKFKNTRIVLDCTEIALESCKCLHCNILSYSHYKGMSTIKFLVGVTPSGFISFLSHGFGGRSSDKGIFNESQLLSALEPNVDAVMADKGFLIEKECTEHGIQLFRPPFLGKNRQFSKDDAVDTVEIASARVHIERVNQRMKVFKLFGGGKFPHHLLHFIDHIAIIVAGIVNLSNPILANDKF